MPGPAARPASSKRAWVDDPLARRSIAAPAVPPPDCPRTGAQPVLHGPACADKAAPARRLRTRGGAPARTLVSSRSRSRATEARREAAQSPLASVRDAIHRRALHGMLA